MFPKGKRVVAEFPEKGKTCVIYAELIKKILYMLIKYLN